MKKYFRAAIYMSYSFAKFIVLKIFHFKHFHFTMTNLISPFTKIELDKKGSLDLGRFIKIRSGSKIQVRSGANVKIGDYTFLNHGCMVVSHEKISIGKNVQIGPNVLIYDHDHDYNSIHGLKVLKYKTSPIVIGENVWIGANTVILRGTKIGNNCVIGAGSVVKGEFPDNTIILQKRETTSYVFKK